MSAIIEKEVRPILKDKLLKYYDTNKRALPWRENTDPYRVWVSEIMLQQTRAGAVIPYFERFMATLPRLEDLARAEETLLHKLWEGLGYYSRVTNLQIAARQILEDFGGQIPSDYQDLVSLRGIGPYTAGAIASIAFNQPVPAIDGNLLRVYSRLYAIEESIDSSQTKKKIFHLAEGDISQDRPGDFNQALMDLANEFCLPKSPSCPQCPLREDCLAYKRGLEGTLPKRRAKGEKKREDWTILVLEKEGRFLIQQRPPKGLLAKLWQFPPLSGHLAPEDVEKYLLERGFIPRNIRKLGGSQHIFSHKIWDMEAYMVSLDPFVVAEEEDFYGPYTWASKEEIQETYPFASALRPYLEEVFTWNG